MNLAFKQDQRKADELWSRAPRPLGDIGTVEHLSILPLSDWYADDDRLVGEAGVSYLIEADGKRILFDTGANWKNEEPSPLLRNMKMLGISPDDLDTVVISHPHCDHVGGMAAMRGRRFMLSPNDVDLGGRTAYVPAPLSHPTATTIVSDEPSVILPGVATIGVIWRAIWLLGLTPEQGLAVNVKDKGIVLVIGCGHQGLTRILARHRQLFSEPLHGIFGGLHYPVTQSRIKRPSQKVIGTGKQPWQRITKPEVEAAIGELEAARPALVGISAHDSCDWTVGRFRDAFGGRYRDIVVGRRITI